MQYTEPTSFGGTLVTILAIAPVAVALYLIFIRGNEIFYVSIREGRALLIRGRIPPSLFTQIADVARRAGVRNATVTAHKGDGRARLTTTGFGEGDAQRLRNVFGLHPIHALRAAPLRRPENLGQVLGIAWLAWMFVGRRS
jgi:hypothetical protein